VSKTSLKSPAVNVVAKRSTYTVILFVSSTIVKTWPLCYCVEAESKIRSYTTARLEFFGFLNGQIIPEVLLAMNTGNRALYGIGCTECRPMIVVGPIGRE
jgi:hypothetical protein